AANFCRNAGFKYHLIALAETHVDANGITEQIGKLAMAAATCDKGSGPVYDYAIARADIATHVGTEAIYDAPWKTHCGIQITVGTAEPRQYKAIKVPKALPARARPKKVVDPSSKRSKARAEALRTRRERLPEHLRDEFDALYINRETAKEDPTPFVIPQQNWDAAADEVSNFPKFDGAEVGTKEGRGHIFHNHAPNLAENINSKYAQWAATLEAKYQGRAEGYRTTKQTMKASPGRAYLKDPEATWWQHLSTLVARYTALVTNGKDPKARQHIPKTVMKKLDDLENPEFSKELFGRKTDPQEIEEWKTQLVTLEYCDVADLHRLSATTMEWSHKAMARAAGRARKRYLDWAKQAWKDSPGKLHRMVTDPKAPRLEDKQPQRTVGDPSTLMNHSADTWRSIWASDSYNAKQIISAYEKAMRLAKEDPLPLIEPQHIQAIVGTANPKKARG
ncbi:unnamed protein product, partial [Prorocentrum cordatum]